MFEQSINTDGIQNIFDLFGSFDNNIRLIQKNFDVKIINRGSYIKIYGEPEDVSSVKKIIDVMIYCLKNQEILDDQKISYIISCVKSKKSDSDIINQSSKKCVFVSENGKSIFAKTAAQKKYIDSIENNFVTFGIGPAGTGKTYISVALAARALKFRHVDRIVLTRPAVEVGESLGFLPGDLQSKIDPYLRPLYDALFDIVGMSGFNKNIQQKNIEIAPLAYMRGRTLNNSFIILDEAQNTTPEQMKMFLTRLGFGSRVVVTGDITQIDLPKNKKSGLVEASKILKGIDGVEFVRFDKGDVVRHKLVKDIIEAYNNYDSRQNKCL